MTILIDPPRTPGHGREWSHLASDTSYDELHDFARLVGIPARGFDGDHYDVPAEHYDRVVAAGATPVTSRELVARLAGAGLRRRRSAALRPRRPGSLLVLPPPLRPGDTVAVVEPAGPTSADRLSAGAAVLEGWGLRVRPAAQLEPAAQPWLAGADGARAAALTAAWTDPDVRAVWCSRGGFGSHRLLDDLDWTRLAAAGPRWLVGFSDVTALHLGFASHLGLATLHAPGVASLAAAATDVVQATRRLVLGGESEVLTGRPGRPGTASGVLVGGNVAVLAASVGTPELRPARGGVALLEDIAEQPYRLDRLLTQLLRSGWFAGVRGVACGTFTDCGDPAVVRELLLARLTPLGVPVVLDLPIGHGPDNRAVVLGRPVTIDGDAGTIAGAPPRSWSSASD